MLLSGGGAIEANMGGNGGGNILVTVFSLATVCASTPDVLVVSKQTGITAPGFPEFEDASHMGFRNRDRVLSYRKQMTLSLGKWC